MMAILLNTWLFVEVAVLPLAFISFGIFTLVIGLESGSGALTLSLSSMKSIIASQPTLCTFKMTLLWVSGRVYPVAMLHKAMKTWKLDLRFRPRPKIFPNKQEFRAAVSKVLVGKTKN
jgi:hypothetical protein